MSLCRSLVVFVVLALSAAGQLAAEPRVLKWSDLAPTVAKIDNPFEMLSSEHINALRKIMRLQTASSASSQIQANRLRVRLAREGLDVDALFAKRLEIMRQRRLVMEGINERLVGQAIRLPGFVLPLKFNDQKAVEFLLVPTVGACIHTPPPPANQIVHVRYPNGIAVKGLYAPVWISGKLSSKRSMKKVSYVDGQAHVAVSYAMQPDFVIASATNFGRLKPSTGFGISK